MRFLSLLLLLAGCPTTSKPTPTDTADSGDTAAADSAIETGDSDAATIISATIILSAAWADGNPPFGGYAMIADASGIYIDQPVGDGTTAYDFRVPYDAGQGVTIEDAADVVLDAGGLYGTDKFALLGDGRIDIPENYATGDADASGIAYVLDEDALISGDIASQAALTVVGGVEGGYTGFTQPLDADRDGTADDLVVTAGPDDLPGQIAVFLDAPTSGTIHWSDADYVLTACEPSDDPNEDLAGMAFVALADGYLLAGCASHDYSDGAVDRFALPLADGAEPTDRVEQSSGWRLAAYLGDAGGYYDEAQGRGQFVYVSPDGERTNIGDASAPSWGSSPVVGDVDGHLLLAFGFPSYEVGETAMGRGGSSAKVGEVYICDVTDDPIPDLAACLLLDGPSDVGTAYQGAVLSWADTDGDGYDDTLASSGWQYGSGKGGGIVAWAVSVE